MKYEWDAVKDRANRIKHGLSFEDAEFVFNGKTVTFNDDRAGYSERKFITLGALAGRVVVIAHTPRRGKTRIISMRKANEREKKIYKKRLKAD
jgi:hypothetical protein